MATIDYYQEQWWKIQSILDKGGLTSEQIATYKGQQAEYHRLAEVQRSYAGYSGGVAGDEIIVLADDPTTPWNEEERFKQTFSDQALTTEGYKDIISQIESGAMNFIDQITGGTVSAGLTQSESGAAFANLAITAVIGLFLVRLIKGVFK